MMRYLYIILGTFSLGLGLLGIVTPGLPTTPFVLLTAFLYAKGSPRLHEKLKNNKITGYYLNRMNGELGWKIKFLSVSIMWCMICFTIFFVFAGNLVMQHVMLGLGIIGTISQLLFLRKRKKCTETLIDKEKEEAEQLL